MEGEFFDEKTKTLAIKFCHFSGNFTILSSFSKEKF